MNSDIHQPWLEWAAAILFAAAILHTFLVKWFHHIANKFPKESVGNNIFHLLGEKEVPSIWHVYLRG